MCPVLLEVVLGPLVCLALLGVGFVLAFLLAWRVTDPAAADRVTASLIVALKTVATAGVAEGATASLPLARDRKPPDLFIPGAIGGVGLLGLAWLFVKREPFAFPLHGYPFMLMIGYALGTVIVIKRAARRGIPQARILDLAMILLISGVIGARAFFVWQFHEQHFDDRPAVVRAAPPSTPLAPNDRLVLEVGDARERVEVVFAGDETTLEAIGARVEGHGKGLLQARPVRTTRKLRDGEVVTKVHGLEIRTTQRGAQARLRVAEGGPAARKLDLEAGVEGRGLSIPWSRPFELWQGGLVVYGGLLLSTVCALLYMRWKKLNVFRVADAIMPILGWGLVWGRMGCTLNGCCWGRESDPGPFSLVFPHGSAPWELHARDVLPIRFHGHLESGEHMEVVDAYLQGVDPSLVKGSHPVVPAQPIGIVLDLLLFGASLLFDRRKNRKDGEVFFATFSFYAVVRFTLEHIRGDHSHFAYVLGYPMTMSQRVAVLTFVVGIVGFLWRRRVGEPVVEVDPATVGADEGKPA